MRIISKALFIKACTCHSFKRLMFAFYLFWLSKYVFYFLSKLMCLRECIVAQAQAKVAGTKVMVIDDSNTIRRSAELFLKAAGCEVVLAEDGFDALSKIAEELPQVIFVDIMMPRLDGYQTCALIKRNPRFKSTPVIMLSSKDGLFDRARGRMAGSDQYLTKPFTQESLVEAVNSYAKET